MVSDEQLMALAQGGDQPAMEALVVRFGGLARHIARDFFDLASGPDDLRQEALIGICFAVRDYQADRCMGVPSFITLVVRRHLIDTVKRATRGKHLALTQAVRAGVDEDGDEMPAVDLIRDAAADPVDVLGRRDDLAAVIRVVNDSLTPLERDVLLATADGWSQLAIQEWIGRPTLKWADGRPRAKTVENALDRARKKVQRALDEAA